MGALEADSGERVERLPAPRLRWNCIGCKQRGLAAIRCLHLKSLYRPMALNSKVQGELFTISLDTTVLSNTKLLVMNWIQEEPRFTGLFFIRRILPINAPCLDRSAGPVGCVNGAVAIQTLVHGVLQSVELPGRTGGPAAVQIARRHLVATFHHRHAATAAADVVPRSMGFRAPRLAKK